MKLRGWEIYQEYVDRGISGAKENKPALDKLMKDARKRKKGIVMKRHTPLFWTIGYLTSHTKLLTALQSGAQSNIHLEDLCSRYYA